MVNTGKIRYETHTTKFTTLADKGDKKLMQGFQCCSICGLYFENRIDALVDHYYNNSPPEHKRAIDKQVEAIKAHKRNWFEKLIKKITQRLQIKVKQS